MNRRLAEVAGNGGGRGVCFGLLDMEYHSLEPGG